MVLPPPFFTLHTHRRTHTHSCTFPQVLVDLLRLMVCHRLTMCSVAHFVTKLTLSYGAGGTVSFLCVAGLSWSIYDLEPGHTYSAANTKAQI